MTVIRSATHTPTCSCHEVSSGRVKRRQLCLVLQHEATSSFSLVCKACISSTNLRIFATNVDAHINIYCVCRATPCSRDTLHTPSPEGAAHSGSASTPRRDCTPQINQLDGSQMHAMAWVARIMTSGTTSCVASLVRHIIYTNVKSLPPGSLGHLPLAAAHQH